MRFFFAAALAFNPVDMAGFSPAAQVHRPHAAQHSGLNRKQSRSDGLCCQNLAATSQISQARCRVDRVAKAVAINL